MSTVYQRRLFSEIKEKLPKDCWAYWRNEKNKGELDNEIVLYCKGDLKVDHLDLNDALSFQSLTIAAGNTEFPLMVLVEGNCTVDQYIYNEDTDGATGLVVLGDLKARNIVVGGQEIYVTGNLEVAELYWGDYNHGELKVNGSISAEVFVSTDYAFDWKRFGNKDRVFVNRWLWSEQDNIDDEAVLALFDKEVLILDEEEEPILWREKILEFFQAGKPVIKPWEKEEIPFVFDSGDFHPLNILRLRQSPLFLDDLPAMEGDHMQRVEYWRGEDFSRVQVQKDIEFSESLYFQRGNMAFHVIWMEQGVDAEGNPDYQISVRVANIPETGQTDWYFFDPSLAAHEPFGEMAMQMWTALQNDWSAMEYWQAKFREAITMERVQLVLGISIVKKEYSNYYGENANPLWNGNFCYLFRQEDKQQGHASRISIIKQLTQDDEPEFAFWHFEITRLPNGEIRPLLMTQDGNGHEFQTYEVSKADIKTYKDAIRHFNAMEKYLNAMNEE